jgi:hypothetical protein
MATEKTESNTVEISIRDDRPALPRHVDPP